MDWSKMRIAGTPDVTHSTFSTRTRRRGVGGSSSNVFVILLAIFGFLIDGAGGGLFVIL